METVFVLHLAAKESGSPAWKRESLIAFYCVFWNGMFQESWNCPVYSR